MEYIPRMEQVTSAANYDNIVVVKPNGEPTTMSRCKNCNIVTINRNFNMWKHWKYTCPYKLLFKYNNPTICPNSGSGMNITCLVCRQSFDETTISFMTTHRTHCRQAQQVEVQRLPNNDSPSFTIVQSPSTDDANEPITHHDVSSSDSTITSYRIEASNENLMRFSIKKTNTLSAEKGRERCTKCHICKNHFVTDSNNLLQTCDQCRDHKSKQVESEQDVIMCVRTVHTDTPDQTIISNVNGVPSMMPKQSQNQVCFICNTDTSESFVDLYGTTAVHSGKSIFDFVWKFLGGRPSVRNDTMDASCLTQEFVCSQCLAMINQYDKAKVIGKRYKKLLRNKLANTENYFARLQKEAGGSTAAGGNQLNSPQTGNADKSKEYEVFDFRDED